MPGTVSTDFRQQATVAHGERMPVQVQRQSCSSLRPGPSPEAALPRCPQPAAVVARRGRAPPAPWAPSRVSAPAGRRGRRRPHPRPAPGAAAVSSPPPAGPARFPRAASLPSAPTSQQYRDRRSLPGTDPRIQNGGACSPRRRPLHITGRAAPRAGGLGPPPVRPSLPAAAEARPRSAGSAGHGQGHRPRSLALTWKPAHRDPLPGYCADGQPRQPTRARCAAQLPATPNGSTACDRRRRALR